MSVEPFVDEGLTWLRFAAHFGSIQQFLEWAESASELQKGRDQ